MKFPLWLTTTVLAWGILIPTKAQSQVVLNLAEPNNLSEQNTEVYTLAKKHKFRKFNRHRGHRGHRRHGRGGFHRNRRHRGHRGHRRHYNGRNHGGHRRSRGVFLRF